MQITAHADVDVVALEQTDEVHVLLELRAPAAPDTGQPRPEHPAVVVRAGTVGDIGGRRHRGLARGPHGSPGVSCRCLSLS